MIDYLIGSKVGTDVPSELKNQADGKIVDHIYKNSSLIDDNDIYYVGDSKYYSDDSEVGKNSIYKQFTYAKNVIQYNINLLHKWAPQDHSKEIPLRYRDELTEGYNITPNFFIRGEIDTDNITYEEVITSRKDVILLNRHFLNRLFDRDTLILKEYNINFLYVLSTYAIHIESNSRRDRLRAMFRNDLIDSLNKSYNFFKVRPKRGYSIEQIIKNHFYEFVGRMYMSDEDDGCIWVALERDKEHLSGKDYPHISQFNIDSEVSEELRVGTREVSGFIEKFFEEPKWEAAEFYMEYNEVPLMAADKVAEYKA
jgi:hypothetical protein